MFICKGFGGIMKRFDLKRKLKIAAYFSFLMFTFCTQTASNPPSNKKLTPTGTGVQQPVLDDAMSKLAKNYENNLTNNPSINAAASSGNGVNPVVAGLFIAVLIGGLGYLYYTHQALINQGIGDVIDQAKKMSSDLWGQLLNILGKGNNTGSTPLAKTMDNILDQGYVEPLNTIQKLDIPLATQLEGATRPQLILTGDVAKLEGYNNALSNDNSNNPAIKGYLAAGQPTFQSGLLEQQATMTQASGNLLGLSLSDLLAMTPAQRAAAIQSAYNNLPADCQSYVSLADLQTQIESYITWFGSNNAPNITTASPLGGT